MKVAPLANPFNTLNLPGYFLRIQSFLFGIDIVASQSP